MDVSPRSSYRFTINPTSVMQGLKTNFEGKNNERHRGNWKMRLCAISASSLYLITDTLDTINQSVLQGSMFSAMR